MNYFAPNYNKKETFMEIFVAIISDHIIGFFQNSKNIFLIHIFLVHKIFAIQLKLSGLNQK